MFGNITKFLRRRREDEVQRAVTVGRIATGQVEELGNPKSTVLVDFCPAPEDDTEAGQAPTK